MVIDSPKMRISCADATKCNSPWAAEARLQERNTLSPGENILILDIPEHGRSVKDNQTLIGSAHDANGRIQTQSKQLMLYITDPVGQRVRDAQAILSLIEPQFHHPMTRLAPWGGGYFGKLKLRGFGIFRIETELISDGQMLTDAFFLIVDHPAEPCCGGIFSWTQ